jgi:cytoskeletal protein CcmA (bactofilin family)
MFYKKSANGHEAHVLPMSQAQGRKQAPSIIVSDLNIEGDISSDGAIEIGGKVKGNVKCKHITVRKSAVIEGNVEADYLVINGKTKSGTLKAKNVTITASARVDGDIEYGYLAVESGAHVNGNCRKVQFDDLEDILEGYDTESDDVPAIALQSDKPAKAKAKPAKSSH